MYSHYKQTLHGAGMKRYLILMSSATHTHTHTHTHTRVHTHAGWLMQVHTHLQIRTHHTCIHTCIQMQKQMKTHALGYAHIHTCTHHPTLFFTDAESQYT